MDNEAPAVKHFIGLDQTLRKLIMDYYMAAKELDDPAPAIELMRQHASILIDMIHDLSLKKS